MEKLTYEQKRDLEKALQQISSEYYKSALEILMWLGDVDELNYLRTPIHMPNGSEYLLAILHVGGPVLSLKKLAAGTVMEGSVELMRITSKESE